MGIFEALPVMAFQSLFFLQLMGQDRAQLTRESVLYFANNHKEQRVWLMTLPIGSLLPSKAKEAKPAKPTTDFLKIVEEHFVLQAKQLVFAFFCSRLASNPSLKAVCCWSSYNVLMLHGQYSLSSF